MEADDEVDLRPGGVARDLAALEAQAACTDTVGERAARLDHVRLEVEPDDLDLTSAQLCEQMVEREREVRLAAAEVDHAQRPVRRGRDGTTSSTSSRNRLTCRNLSNRLLRTLPSGVITPSSTR